MFRKFILILFGMELLFLQGCGSILPSHIHSPGREAIAVEAQQIMNDYAGKSPEMYSAMLLNLQNFKVEEDFLLDQLSKNYAVAFATKAPTKSWVEYKNNIKKIKSEGDIFDKLIVKKAKLFLELKDKANEDLTSADEAIKKAEEKEKELRTIVDNWNQLNALLRNAYASLPNVLNVMEEGQHSDDSLTKLSGHLSTEEITYVDSYGKEVKADVSKIVQTSQSLFTEKVDLKSIPPGIDLIVLNLGLELAEVQKKKAQAELNSLVARTRLFEDALVVRQLTKTLIKSAEKKVELLEKIGTTPLQLISSQIGQQNKLAPDQTINVISNVLLTVRIISVSQILIERSSVSLELGLERLDHRDSIILSSSADEAWQSVIRSGTSGLTAYHKAGWSDEDTANVLRTAQTIALAVISGGVL